MKNDIFGAVPAGMQSHGVGSTPSNRFITAPPQSVAAIPDFTGTASQFQVVQGVRIGLNPQVAGRRVRFLLAALEATQQEMARLLAIPAIAVARLGKPSIALTAVETERLFLLEQLLIHGEAVFEDRGKFSRWLRRPLSILQNQPPLEWLDTATGFRVVDQLLGRIEHGVYS